MTDYGIKISKPNISVLDAKDTELVQSSSFPTFKIFRIVRFTNPGNVLHGLDYPPTFMALSKVDGVWRWAGYGYQMGGFPFVNVNSTRVYSVSSDEVYVILFTESLNE